MVVLGIDPGLAIVGYGVLRKERGITEVLDYGVINTPKDESVPVRLAMIEENLKALIDKYAPEEVPWKSCFSTTIKRRQYRWRRREV